MPTFDNANYITIQGWMINELNLKGNELLLYAIIFGFTQQENQWYHGSLNYISKAIGCKSKNTVINTLQSLIEKGYVIKENYELNNVKLCKYKANHEVYQNLVWVYQNLVGGIPKNGTNNNIYNIKENNNISNDILLKEKSKKKSLKKEFIPPTLQEVEEYCKSRNNNVNAKKFWEYYTENNWLDKDNKPVTNWKLKLIGNWESEENKNGPDVEKTLWWFNKNVEKIPISEEEQVEMEELLKEFKN